ncbi:hypothetical protein DFA_09746 [Cavenderia fasciculata]|uniref:Transmembrane protein n=1 Tax=Cavenderia fasciculata TaxID=261658 RepID=F4Q8H4_CACFS|nr:uncharacterized protein DFA_09746 [Cavenderia fasciculata]EGG16074.1 hypothetical protein DFA_09746 [Cavenderia fasciculata]|eukprot:XP_004352399.1 hypothetical protein DFA_09746 [Cavenderia fasciculata]
MNMNLRGVYIYAEFLVESVLCYTIPTLLCIGYLQRADKSVPSLVSFIVDKRAQHFRNIRRTSFSCDR